LLRMRTVIRESNHWLFQSPGVEGSMTLNTRCRKEPPSPPPAASALCPVGPEQDDFADDPLERKGRRRNLSCQRA
jgi:hypothetical protein